MTFMVRITLNYLLNWLIEIGHCEFFFSVSCAVTGNYKALSAEWHCHRTRDNEEELAMPYLN